MRNLKIILILVISISAITLIGWGAIRAIQAIIGYASTIPKELGAPLIAAAATILVATLTVVLGKYFERKKELDALYREKKTEVYDEFLKRFFEVFHSGGGNNDELDLVNFLRDFSRKLILWSGPEVIEAFVAWKGYLANGTADAKSIFLTEEFLLAIRKDLRQSNRGIRRGVFARMFLKNGEIFLQMSAKNPNITLDRLAEIERLLDENTMEKA